MGFVIFVLIETAWLLSAYVSCASRRLDPWARYATVLLSSTTVALIIGVGVLLG